MTSADPASLSNLRGLAMPAPISWWPPQPGWWILLAGAAALCLVGVSHLLRRYRADAYRRAALRELRGLERHAAEEIAVPLATLLKRVALTAYSRPEVAGLTSSAWAEFLNIGAASPIGAVRRAAIDPRVPLSEREAREAVAAARAWIRRHRRDPRS